MQPRQPSLDNPSRVLTLERALKLVYSVPSSSRILKLIHPYLQRGRSKKKDQEVNQSTTKIRHPYSRKMEHSIVRHTTFLIYSDSQKYSQTTKESSGT
jgi:hypothetical protein